jgi:putative two-component system response regulator
MTSAGSQRVLVVDDMEDHRELVVDLLLDEGYCVDVATDGLKALDAAFGAPPDLVLLDVTMPGLSGFEVCRRLKADSRTRLVPVVMITGLNAREDRVQGIAAGCDDFLTKPVDVEQLLARTRTALRMKSLTDQLEEAENVLVSLANALDAKDPYTRGHSERVARLSEELGRAAGLPEERARTLRRAGLIHDIGKIGVPLAYLGKPGALTEPELVSVRRHPAIGHEICSPLRTLEPILPLVRGHHERLDGTGYPDGLRGDEISLDLRCLSVADVYDALTSVRPYRAALSHEAAIEILEGEALRGHWDPEIIRLLDGLGPVGE